MARITKGNKLATAVLMPGWTIEDDGFGLLTCKADYTISHGTSDISADGASALSAVPKRGDAFSKDKRLICHNVSSTLNSNGLQIFSAQYCGIATGNVTVAEVSGRGSMSTEPIETHPNFATTVLAGTVDDPQNGAKFNADGSFDGFVEHTTVTNVSGDKYGVKSYLNAGFGITGSLYTTDMYLASKLVSAMGETSWSGIFRGVNLLGDLSGLRPTWSTSSDNGGFSTVIGGLPQLLLTGISLEFFGTLVKVSFDITFAVNGWDVDIYYYGEQTGVSKKDTPGNSGGWATNMHTNFQTNQKMGGNTNLRPTK
jgi:hypothetical protein